jgi:ABC-type Zn uptake system ZnuABC Zn-binding protein ZnuA
MGRLAGIGVRRGAAVARLLMIAVLSWMVLGACGVGTGDEDGRVRVVATFSVLGELVERVGGEEVEVRTLVGVNGDTHGFTPSPADQVAIARAELVFENGLGFEVWLDRLMESLGSTAERIVLSEGMEILSPYGNAPDPHVWLDVRNMILMVDRARGALGEAAPDRAAEFDRRARALTLELEELDRWIFEQIETIPPERRKLVTNHDSFGYFARRYGLEVVGMVIPSVTDDIVAPVAGEIAALVDLIREEGSPAVFAENVSNSRLAEQVAREAGVRLVEGLYTGALGEAGSEGETYEGMMRANVRLIVGAWR